MLKRTDFVALLLLENTHTYRANFHSTLKEPKPYTKQTLSKRLDKISI